MLFFSLSSFAYNLDNLKTISGLIKPWPLIFPIGYIVYSLILETNNLNEILNSLDILFKFSGLSLTPIKLLNNSKSYGKLIVSSYILSNCSLLKNL